MSEAKPTPGPCYHHGPSGSQHTAGGFINNTPDRYGSPVICSVYGTSGQPHEANARLILDAFNTLADTGLTPSQLVERVKELEEALRKYEDVREDMFGFFLSNGIFNQWGKRYDCSALNNAHLQASAALSKARPNTAEGEAAQQAPAAERENLELRRMLCIAHAGAAAYMDDGEAQDNRELPLIDFLHDTPAEIQDKLQRRALKKLAMTTEATTARWPSYEVAVSDPVFQVARSIMGTENMGQDRQLVAAINHVLAAATTPAAAKEPSP